MRAAPVVAANSNARTHRAQVRVFGDSGSFVDLNNVATALGLVNSAASPMTFTLDFSGSTQFGSAFGVNSIAQVSGLRVVNSPMSRRRVRLIIELKV